MKNTYYLYIIANEFWTIYIWVTNNIERRLYEHKNWLIEWFSKLYKCYKLVYIENCNDINSSIIREKQLKRWSRIKKSELINKDNPNWEDISLKWS